MKTPFRCKINELKNPLRRECLPGYFPPIILSHFDSPAKICGFQSQWLPDHIHLENMCHGIENTPGCFSTPSKSTKGSAGFSVKVRFFSKEQECLHRLKHL